MLTRMITDLHSISCKGRGQTLYSVCIQVGDKCWHSGCLRCSVCQTPLNCHSSCFLKYDQVDTDTP